MRKQKQKQNTNPYRKKGRKKKEKKKKTPDVVIITPYYFPRFLWKASTSSTFSCSLLLWHIKWLLLLSHFQWIIIGGEVEARNDVNFQAEEGEINLFSPNSI